MIKIRDNSLRIESASKSHIIFWESWRGGHKSNGSGEFSNNGGEFAGQQSSVHAYRSKKVTNQAKWICFALQFMLKKMRTWTKVVNTPLKPEPSCNGGGISQLLRLQPKWSPKNAEIDSATVYYFAKIILNKVKTNKTHLKLLESCPYRQICTPLYSLPVAHPRASSGYSTFSIGPEAHRRLRINLKTRTLRYRW